jgi:NAD(P)-dependent dehydrogenase (short-subunit alcohol dehydrogenase family)
MGKIVLNDLHYKNGRKYRGWPAYGQSKLANLIFAKELAKRLKEQKHDHVTAVSVSPGIIRTNLWRYTNFFL